MKKARIWYNPDAAYIGATGCDSIREMAEMAKADTGNGIAELLFGEEVDDPSIAEFEAKLNALGVQPVIMASAHARKESWEPEWTTPCDIADKPGRGRVKILGLSL